MIQIPLRSNFTASNATENQKIVEVTNLTKNFELAGQTIPILNGITMDLASGEFAAIVGPSGNGKSTLLNMITGIDHPTSRNVIVNGQNLKKLNEDQLSIWRGKKPWNCFSIFSIVASVKFVAKCHFANGFYWRIETKRTSPTG